MRLDRWSNPSALDSLSKKIDQGLQAVVVAEKPPCVNCNGKAEKPRPRYEWHKSIMVRLFGSGCSSCGSNGLGWFQNVLVNPDRKGRWFPRTVAFSLWVASLFPRGWSIAQTVFSRKVPPGEYMARMKTCFDQSSGPNACAIRFLKHTKRGIVETLHCGLCRCPRTRWAALTRKNKRKGWRCPQGLHMDSQTDKVYTDYVQVQLAEIEGAKAPVEN